MSEILAILQPKQSIHGVLQPATTQQSDYNKLNNKPKINGVELSGDVSLEDLDVAESADTLAGYGITDAYTKTEVDAAINELDGNIDVLIGSVSKFEASMKATRAYTVGDYINVHGKLYKANKAIASGATLSTSTNVDEVTIGDELKANAQSIATAAEQIASNAEEITNVKADLNSFTENKSPNLFDGDFDESGYIDDGVDKSSSSFKRTSKYYPIEGESDGNLYAFLSTTVDVFSVLFFDSTKTWISNATVNNVTSKTITLPNNAKFFRAYTRTAFDGNVTLSLTPISSYIPYAEGLTLKGEVVGYTNLKSELADMLQEKHGINIFDNNFDSSGYIDDGVDKPSSSYVRTTSFYPVDATKGNLYVYHQNSGTVSMLFFDSSKQWIKNVNISSAGTTNVVIPSNASYFRCYKNVNVTDGITVAYTSVSAYIPYTTFIGLKDNSVDYDMLTDDVKARLGVPLLGKTIAFMGDSIIGNFYDSTGVCAVLAEKTGATVINCAFGGTRLAYSVGESIQYTYMNAISGVGLSDAIASGVWTDQDTAIAGLTGVPDYFADRLATIKAIDWSEVDFIMWEYGTNDFMNRVMVSDEADPTNLYAFDNAYRHAIETILTEYPNIRIITATPIYRWYQSGGVFTDDSNTHTETDYDGGTSTLIDFIEVAQNVSREYQIPCIDDYYTMGANKFTRLAYFDSTDGTHPNANGRERIAEHLASQLVTLI